MTFFLVPAFSTLVFLNEIYSVSLFGILLGIVVYSFLQFDLIDTHSCSESGKNSEFLQGCYVFLPYLNVQCPNCLCLFYPFYIEAYNVVEVSVHEILMTYF